MGEIIIFAVIGLVIIYFIWDYIEKPGSRAYKNRKELEKALREVDREANKMRQKDAFKEILSHFYPVIDKGIQEFMNQSGTIQEKEIQSACCFYQAGSYNISVRDNGKVAYEYIFSDHNQYAVSSVVAKAVEKEIWHYLGRKNLHFRYEIKCSDYEYYLLFTRNNPNYQAPVKF